LVKDNFPRGSGKASWDKVVIFAWSGTEQQPMQNSRLNSTVEKAAYWQYFSKAYTPENAHNLLMLNAILELSFCTVPLQQLLWHRHLNHIHSLIHSLIHSWQHQQWTSVDRSKSYELSTVSNNANNDSTIETWFRYDKQSATLSLVQNGTSLSSSSSRHVTWSENDNRDLPVGKVIGGQILWTKDTTCEYTINYNVHFNLVWQDFSYCCDGSAVMYKLFALLIMV